MILTSGFIVDFIITMVLFGVSFLYIHVPMNDRVPDKSTIQVFLGIVWTIIILFTWVIEINVLPSVGIEIVLEPYLLGE